MYLHSTEPMVTICEKMALCGSTLAVLLKPTKQNHNVKCTYSLQTLKSYTDMEFEVKLVKINSDISCT